MTTIIYYKLVDYFDKHLTPNMTKASRNIWVTLYIS